MEHALAEMARKLDALDEASLTGLWDKYAAIVAGFEPSRRWEEAAMILGLIQTKRWKNQLFNHRLAESLGPGPRGAGAGTGAVPPPVRDGRAKGRRKAGRDASPPSAQILPFRRRGD